MQCLSEMANIQCPTFNDRTHINRGSADDGIRTRDLRFTKPLLYQLSYVGAKRAKHCIRRRLTQALCCSRLAARSVGETWDSCKNLGLTVSKCAPGAYRGKTKVSPIFRSAMRSGA